MGSSNNVINDYIAGALGGAAGLVVGHPFDTTKVQLQTQHATRPYKGTWDAIKNINNTGWTKGFFRGLGFPLVSYGVVNSVFFGVYGNTLSYMTQGKTVPSNVDIFTAGCVGGAMQLIVACPVDVVKVVLQSQISRNGKGCSAASQSTVYTGPTQCLREMVRHGGLRSLYKGLPVMAARDLPASSSYFLIYENLSEAIKASKFSDEHGIVADLVAGGMAGVLSWALIIPLDIVKSQLQADIYTTHTAADIVRATYARGGVRAFYTGLGVTCLRAFPTNAVIFLVYSQSMKLLNAATPGSPSTVEAQRGLTEATNGAL